MKTVKTLAVLLLLAASSQAKGKVQYDVCAIEGVG